MMNSRIVTLITISILFGSAICEASNLRLSVYDGSNQWWIAVKPTGGSVATSKMELQESGSSTWNTMFPEAGWGFFQLGSTGEANGYNFPLSLRLTATNGKVLVLSNILTSDSAGSSINSQTNYGSATNSDNSHHHQPTTEPPTSAPNHHHSHTQAPTAAPTAAPTQKATTAPTVHATQAPTQHATAAPTQKATTAPTQHATSAPTTKATQKPTTAPTSGSSTSLCTVTPTSSEPIKLLVPLYIYPGSTWTQVANAQTSGVDTIAIINPNNGPESSGPDSSYTTYMAQLNTAGVTMIGYIHTLYGARAIADVIADINTYATKYPGLAGIFVDECATSANEVSYYQQVYAAIMSHSGYVHAIINPGTQPDQGYLAVSTNIVIFEDKASAWTGNLFSSWIGCAPNAASKAGYKYKFSGIAYAGTQAQMQTLLPAFEAAGMGMVYVTNGAAGGNTYNSLPSYFSTMVADIAALN